MFFLLSFRVRVCVCFMQIKIVQQAGNANVNAKEDYDEARRE